MKQKHPSEKSTKTKIPSHTKLWAGFAVVLVVGAVTLTPVALLTLIAGVFRIVSKLVNKVCQYVAAKFFFVFERTADKLGFLRKDEAAA